MAAEHVLKVPRSEDEGNSIMLNIRSNGSKPLDLALLATDGDSAWASTVKQSKCSKLRSKNSPVNETEWLNVLSSVLQVQLGDQDDHPSKSAERFELVSLIAGDQLTFIVRRNVSGITQRLGEITLQVLTDEEAGERVELLDWVGVAVDKTTSLQANVEDLSLKYEEQGKVIQKLNQQLEDLIEAKKEHESALLQKFQELLNEKKLKIRDQLRLLAGAKLDAQKAPQVQALRRSGTRRSPDRSRAAKRKANGISPTKAETDSDEDLGFEKVPPAAPEDEEGEETPPHSDVDATEDESEDEAMASAPPPSDSTKSMLIERREKQQSPPASSEPLVLPPRRELPFAKQSTSNDNARVSTDMKPMDTSHINDPDGSETSDDEL